MRTYFIRTTKQAGTATLYTQFQTTSVNGKLATGIPVSIGAWTQCGQDVEKYDKADKDHGREVYELCQQVEAVISARLAMGTTMDELRTAVSDIVTPVVKAWKSKGAVSRKPANVLEYLSKLIEDMKAGKAKIRTKGNKNYADSSIGAYTTLHNLLKGFTHGTPLAWSAITEQWANAFTDFMAGRGMMAKSINLNNALLRSIVNRAYREHQHDDARMASHFVGRKVADVDKATEIYLTAEEVEELYRMELTGGEEMARDLFVVGICTAQRVSDYSTLSRENFGVTARGTKVVRLYQQKTHNKVVIPVLDSKLESICEKYGYDLPQLSAETINKHLRNVCRRLADNVPSLMETMPTTLTMKERDREQKAGRELWQRDGMGRALKPRWEMITSHTARRTAVTNLYLSGKFDTLQMMAISGHKDVKTFTEYIRLSGDEIADKIAEQAGDDGLF